MLIAAVGASAASGSFGSAKVLRSVVTLVSPSAVQMANSTNRPVVNRGDGGGNGNGGNGNGGNGNGGNGNGNHECHGDNDDHDNGTPGHQNNQCDDDDGGGGHGGHGGDWLTGGGN